MNKVNYENVKIVKTTNKKLENFLYMLDVLPLYHEKDWTGSTVWVYEDTPELRDLVRTYNDVNARRKALCGS